MFSSLRDRFGIPGVIAVVALVFAMAGGAWAAKGVIITKLNQISPSVQKQLKGKVGPAGPAGSAGSAGSKGDTGAKGDAGTPGTSATTITFPGVKGSCTVGGIEVKSASPPVNVCNGKEGSPWTAGGLLPPGETETGAWSGVTQTTDFGPAAIVPISFSIPLGAELGGANTHFSSEVGFATNCPGTAEEPEANEGHLCVYVGHNVGATFITFQTPAKLSFSGAGTTGAVLLLEGEPGKIAWGTWAVTAP
jgi:hypothetical protein